MTRKQAIYEAICILNKDKQNQQICQRLQEIYEEYPLNHWTKKAIFDAIDQFILENGRFPAKTDFHKTKGLPSAGEIRFKFDLSYGAFREQYYPDTKYYTKKVTYEDATFWTEVFVKQYTSFGYPTEEEYNKKRAKGTPHTKTMMNILDCRNWSELLKKCDVFEKPKEELHITAEEDSKTEEEYELIYKDIAKQLGIEVEK